MKSTFPYPSLAPPIEQVPASSEDAYSDPRCSLDFIIYQGGERWASDWIRIQNFQGQDSISDFFHYQVELRANDQYVPARSTTPAPKVRPFDFSKILGATGMIRIGLPAKSGTDGQPLEPVVYTPFCGMVTDLTCAGPGVYHVTLKPHLFKLTLRNGYRIFKGLTVKGVVDTLLSEHGIKDYDLSALDGVADGRQQDWLQAGESDYEFMHRLLQKVGGYFYFEHQLPAGPQSPGVDKVIFGREVSYKELLDAEGETLKLYYTFSKNASGLDFEDLVTNLSYQQTLLPNGVSTTIAEVGSSWLQEPLAQVTSSAVDTDAEPPTCIRYSVFQYGTCQSETDQLSTSRENALHASTYTLSGGSSATRLKSGHWFTLSQKVPPASGGDRDDVANYRPDLDGQSFVLMSVSHHATVEGDYSNQFQARDHAGSVLRFNIAETHQGSVLAQVVAHGGQGNASHPRHYLATGNFALGGKTFENKLQGASSGASGGSFPCKGVFVQFVVGDTSPVFVKVSGSSPSIPEVGTWVIVARANDDGELPEIQQMVQSKGSQIIVPDEENPRWATEHTSVGNNYNTNYGDSHGIRYGRKSPVDLDAAASDLKKAYSSGDYRDVSYSIGGSYSVSKADTGKGGVLSHSLSVGSTYSESTSATTESIATIDKSTSTSTIGDLDSNTTITGTSNSVSDINISLSDSTIGNSTSTSLIKKNTTSTSTVNGNSDNTSTVKGNSTSKSTVNGNSTSTSTVNGNSTNHSTINGTSTSTTTIPGTSNSTSTIGTSSNVSTIGASTSSSTIGTSTSNSITGAVASNAVTGASASNSVTGASASSSVTGAVVSSNITGAVASSNITGASATSNITGASATSNITGASATLEILGAGVVFKNKTAADVEVKIIGSKISALDTKIPALDMTV